MGTKRTGEIGDKDEQVTEKGYPDSHLKSTCREPKGSRNKVKVCFDHQLDFV